MAARGELSVLLDQLQIMQEEGRWAPLPLKQVANILAPVLRDSTGKLGADLDELWAYARRVPGSFAAIFVMEPHSSVVIERRLWRVKAIVTIAQAFDSRNPIVTIMAAPSDNAV